MSEIKEILEDVKRHIDYLDTTNQNSIRDNEMRVMYYEIQRLKADLHEANDSVTWWNNRYNAIVKQNDDNHKKLVKEQEEIERLKEEYVMLQNASDEVEEEKDKEIGRLTAESTKWESKFYDEAKKVDKAIEYINWVWNNTNKPTNTIVALRTLENILKGSDKE